MATKFFNSIRRRVWGTSKGKPRGKQTAGFTLIELLVVVFIGGIIISGLMYLVVELAGTDRRESARSETQREMQMALDYISSDVREAVYVYDTTCFQRQGSPGDNNFCPGLNNHIPMPTNSVPVLAFWKQNSLPEAVRNQCTGSATTPTIGTTVVPCLASKSYALIVYYLVQNTPQSNPGNTWKGTARIVRYALTQFNTDGTVNNAYVSPNAASSFLAWPFGNNRTTGAFDNLQTAVPAVTGANPATLVDFVDDGRGSVARGITPGQEGRCPDDPVVPGPEYIITPSDAFLSARGLNGVRSFYACVSTGTANQNKDTIIFLRGNAKGRPGMTSNAGFLPTLETRVLSRGVLDKS